jgi:hypothetical protein
VRTWARVVFGAVAALAGGLIALSAVAIEALAEEGDTTQGTGLMRALGIATIVLGLAAIVIPWADLGALAIIALVFLLAYGGETPNGDTVYMAIAGVALLLLGLVSLIGRRGGERPRPPDEEPGGRAPPSA